MNVIKCDRCGRVIEGGYKFQFQACRFNCGRTIKVWDGCDKHLDLCDQCYTYIYLTIIDREDKEDDKT